MELDERKIWSEGRWRERQCLDMRWRDEDRHLTHQSLRDREGERECVCEWHFYKPSDERPDKPLPLPHCSLQLHLSTEPAVCVCPSFRGVSSVFVWDCLSLCHLGPVSPTPWRCVCARTSAWARLPVTYTMSIYTAMVGKGVCRSVHVCM